MLKNCNSTERRERANEVRVTFSYQYKIISKHLQESNHEIAKGRIKELFDSAVSPESSQNKLNSRSSPPIEVARAIA